MDSNNTVIVVITVTMMYYNQELVQYVINLDEFSTDGYAIVIYSCFMFQFEDMCIYATLQCPMTL
jgi:hypothetical protein